MAKVIDLGIELLKTFFAPKNELLNTSGLSAKNLRAYLEQKGISDFLNYRYYKEDDDGLGVYHMEDGRKGIILRVFPTSKSSQTIEDSVFNLVETTTEKDTILFFNTFASRNINYLLENFKELHHCNVNVDNAHVLKEMIDDTYHFLKKGNRESLIKNLDFRVKDFVCTISILFPLGTTDEKISKTFYQAKGNLRNLNPTNFGGTDLVRVLREIVNPDDTMEDWDNTYDRHMVMNRQITGTGTKITTPEGVNHINVGDNWKYRTFTTKQFPNKDTIITSYDFYNLFFDRFGDNLQIPLPCPFFASLVINVGDIDKDKERATVKSRDDVAKVNKIKRSTRDVHPELGDRLEEGLRTIKLVEQQNQVPSEAMFQVTLMEDNESKLDEYSKVLVERFRAKDWKIEEEKFGNVSLFSLLFSLPLQQDNEVDEFLRRKEILFTSNNAAIAPLLGNIASNKMLIPYIDRNGQIIPYDNFKGDNYNEAKTGAPGSGKSFSQAYSHIMKLAAGVKQRVIDNGHSYRRFCQVIGGTYIDVGGDDSISLNFFTKANTKKIKDEKGVDTEEEFLVDGGNGIEVVTLHDEEIVGIVPIIGLMLGLDFITSSRKQSAVDATDEAYLASKITSAVIETFLIHRYDGRLEYTRGIIKRYFNEEKEVGNRKHADLLHSVYTGLYNFADPLGTHYKKFNTPNNLDLSKDYVVLDTLGLKGIILDVVLVSLAFSVKSEFWKEGVKRQKSLDIDEGWMYKNNEIVINILEDNARTLRKSMSSQSFITQGIEDFKDNKSMIALFDNSFHKFLLSQDPKTIKKVASGDFFPMDDFEVKMFSSVANKKPYYGECCHISKNTGTNVYIIKTSPKIFWLAAGADPEGNKLFDETQKKHNLSMLETIRYLVYKSENENLTDYDLIHMSKKYNAVKSANDDEDEKYWKKELPLAIKEKRVQVRAEQIYNVKTDKVSGYEIFSQIEHHDKTCSSFRVFNKWSKKMYLEDEISKIIIIKAFDEFEDSNMDLHINITSDDIRSTNYIAFLREIIQRYSMQNRIVLELKDTDRNNNVEELTEFIRTFKEINVKIALDNIGLHYHKVAHLITLDVDYIKLEGALISDLEHNESSKLFFEMIVAFAKKSKHKKKIVALKTEHIKDIKKLKEFDIDFCQGWAFKNEQITF